GCDHGGVRRRPRDLTAATAPVRALTLCACVCLNQNKYPRGGLAALREIVTMDQPKLIITATVAPSWIYPDARNNAKTPEDAVEEVVNAWKAGAAVAHVHGRMNFDEDEWRWVIK